MRKGRSGSHKQKLSKSSESDKLRRGASDDRAGGAGRDDDATPKRTLKPAAKVGGSSPTAVGDADDASKSKKKQKYAVAAVATKAEEAGVEEEKSGEGGCHGSSASGSASDGNHDDRNKKKRVGSKSRSGKRKKGESCDTVRVDSGEDDQGRVKTGSLEQPKTRGGAAAGEGVDKSATENAGSTGGAEGGGERGPGVVVGWEEVTGRGPKQKKSKKPRDERRSQRQPSSDKIHSRSNGGSGTITAGTVEQRAAGSKRGPDGIVPPAQDHPDPRAAVVAEGSGSDARGDSDNPVDGDEFDGGWASQASRSSPPAHTPVDGRGRRATATANVVPVNPVSSSVSTAELSVARVLVSGVLGT